jgi:hypothetical protein
MARGIRKPAGVRRERESAPYFPADGRAAVEWQERQRASRLLEAVRFERSQMRLATD